MANKPEIKNERTHGGKDEEKREKQTKNTFSTNKKEEARNVSEQGDKGRIHVIRVHDTVHSADSNTAGQHILTNYPTQGKNETTPLTRTS